MGGRFPAVNSPDASPAWAEKEMVERIANNRDVFCRVMVPSWINPTMTTPALRTRNHEPSSRTSLRIDRYGLSDLRETAGQSDPSRRRRDSHPLPLLFLECHPRGSRRRH